MISPGAITNSVPDPDEAIRLQRDVQRNAQEQASARSLGQSQIGTGGTLTVAGALVVTGSISTPGVLSSAGGLTATAGNVSAPAGNVSAGGNVTAGGNVGATGQVSGASLAVSGNATVGGNTTVSGQVFVPNSFAAVSGYTVAYINSDGRLSLGASAAKFKQDFEPVNDAPLVEGILRAPLLRFHLIAAVEELGDDAALEIGLLADYLLKIGLGEFVYTDAEGEVRGINYERLTIPLIATVQALDARLKAVTERLDDAGI